MSNADMPAMPVQIEFGKGYHVDFDGNGLTKREYFAGLAMQAIVSNGDNHAEYTASKIAFFAIELADELLKQLEGK